MVRLKKNTYQSMGLALCSVFSILIAKTFADDSLSVPFRILCGATESFTDSAGIVWSADTAYNGGEAADRSGTTVTGADNIKIFAAERYSVLDYTFLVKNGTYAVNLYFCEMYVTNEGERVFDVAINDSIVLPQFDIYKDAGDAANQAVIKKFVVNVTDGNLKIAFTAGTQNTVINGIEILPTGTTTVLKRVVSGTGTGSERRPLALSGGYPHRTCDILGRGVVSDRTTRLSNGIYFTKANGALLPRALAR